MSSDISQNFIHLRVHSAYSLAEGAIPVKKLVKLCEEKKMPAVAITDSNNMFGAMEFSMTASASGIQPIIGTQILVSPFEAEKTDKPVKLVLLAQNEAGYRNLCHLMTRAYMDEDSHYDPQVTLSDLFELSDNIICLSGGLDGPLAPLLLQKQLEQAEVLLDRFHEVFKDRYYIEIQRHDMPDEEVIEPLLLDFAYKKNIPIVATNDCFFIDRKMHEAHDALLCIAEGRYVSETDRRTVTEEHYFKSQAEMIECFKDLPEAIENTVQIARRCSWYLEPIDPILPPYDCGEGRDEAQELEHQSREGLAWRLEKYVLPFLEDDKDPEEVKKTYFERLDFELDIINTMGFPGYFLIVADFIQWAKDHDIPVGPGRGSGAASIVAWSLKITDLDPIALDLLFERFLNPERVSMPDFDIDFCQDRRDEVIDYVKNKYGHDKVAQIITFGKLQARAVVRDVGRVLQMPYGQVDRIAKLIPSNPANPVSLSEALETEADLRVQRDSDPSVNKLITIALQLEGLYRHASTHAAGVVIGDRPLQDLIPVYRDPRSPMPVTQFNMKFIEQAGLIKFDFLGLKTLTVLQKSVEIVAEEEKTDIDLLSVSLGDETTFNMLKRGENTGVFQLESAGMRDVGRQMRLEQFEEIIALVALYRPGPMDNIPLYIEQKFSEGGVRDYMHPLLEPVLEETFGVMIYQEQVMQAAQILAGYTLGGADLLRRAMGKKIMEEMDKQRAIFIKGSAEHNDVPEEQASGIFDQIAKFAGYGFNKAHAACYALIAYQTAYMKANYPVEFFAASMTLDLGNTDKLNIFAQELDRLKIDLLPPDVNYSQPIFAVEHIEDEQGQDKKAIRYALAAIKGVGRNAMEALIAEREENGLFKDIFDMASRLDSKVMNKRQLENLIKAGALDGFGMSRAALMESVETIINYASSIAQEKASGQESLFGGPQQDPDPQNLPKISNRAEWDIIERLQNEFDAVGFYLSAHPLDSEADKLAKKGVTPYADILQPGGPTGRVKLAGVILKKQERTSAKGNRFAFVQLSDATGVFEAITFSETLFANRDLLVAGNTVIMNTDIQAPENEGDAPRLLAQGFEQLDQALANVTSKIHMDLEGLEGLYQIAQILKDSEDTPDQTRPIKVSMSYPVESFGVVADFEFSKPYALSPAQIRALRAVNGLIELLET